MLIGGKNPVCGEVNLRILLEGSLHHTFKTPEREIRIDALGHALETAILSMVLSLDVVEIARRVEDPSSVDNIFYETLRHLRWVDFKGLAEQMFNDGEVLRAQFEVSGKDFFRDFPHYYFDQVFDDLEESLRLPFRFLNVIPEDEYTYEKLRVADVLAKCLDVIPCVRHPSPLYEEIRIVRFVQHEEEIYWEFFNCVRDNLEVIVDEFLEQLPRIFEEAKKSLYKIIEETNVPVLANFFANQLKEIKKVSKEALLRRAEIKREILEAAEREILVHAIAEHLLADLKRQCAYMEASLTYQTIFTEKFIFKIIFSLAGFSPFQIALLFSLGESVIPRNFLSLSPPVAELLYKIYKKYGLEVEVGEII